MGRRPAAWLARVNKMKRLITTQRGVLYMRAVSHTGRGSRAAAGRLVTRSARDLKRRGCSSR